MVEHCTENAGVISSTLILGTYCPQVRHAGKAKPPKFRRPRLFDGDQEMMISIHGGPDATTTVIPVTACVG